MGGMLTSKHFKRWPFLWLLLLILITSACSGTQLSGDTPSPTAETEIATPTPLPPTPVPEPAAAVVNGQRISLAWFQNEVARYLIVREDAEQPLAEPEAAEIVLNDLIDQVLLAQGAQEAGYEVSLQDVENKIDDFSNSVDLVAWMSEWGYSEEDLRFALQLQMLAAEQRNRIAAGVPEVVEQLELRQVFAFTAAGARDALLSLNSGREFEEVAFIYDNVTGGYLGWVPRGYLLIPALEEAAFNLEVGNYSEIVESEIGYHIVKVLDREERPLNSDARLVLERQAVQDWLEVQRENSTVEVLVD